MKALKILKKIFTSIALGVVDSIPLLPNIKNNFKSDNGLTSPGSVDLLRITTSIISVILLVCFLMGKLNIEEVEKLLKLFT